MAKECMTDHNDEIISERMNSYESVMAMGLPAVLGA